jgi:hypothetical protein
MFSTWKETEDIQVLIACAIQFPSPPLSLSRSLNLQKENGDSGAERVLCAAVCEA